jgi:hypothetical protein
MSPPSLKKRAADRKTGKSAQGTKKSIRKLDSFFSDAMQRADILNLPNHNASVKRFATCRRKHVEVLPNRQLALCGQDRYFCAWSRHGVDA